MVATTSIRTRSEPRRRRCAWVLAALVAAAQLCAPARVALADDDPMAEYRERFKAGYEKYKAGLVAEAIQYWEPIYRELGASRGYRMAFNLARAYETFGDFTRAAERYTEFISEVDARRKRNERLDAIVEKEDREARGRLLDLVDKKGRIKVDAGDRPVAVRIDTAEPRISGFIAYVQPGAHVVVLGAGGEAPERRDVNVKAGEMVEVGPPMPVEVPASSAPTPLPSAGSPTPEPARAGRSTSSSTSYETRVDHPFPAAIVFVGAGLTLVSIAFPIITYSSALSFQKNNQLSSDGTVEGQAHDDAIRSDYDARSTAFYATLAIPITLGALTTGLATVYLLGSHERVVPVAAPSRDGMTAGVRVRF